jgi:hypothetical protein
MKGRSTCNDASQALVLVTDAEQQTDTKKFSNKSMKECRLSEAVSIGLEELATCLYVVNKKDLRVEPRERSYERCVRPTPRPLEI